jgi:peptide/nickel transport system permease protein
MSDTAISAGPRVTYTEKVSNRRTKTIVIVTLAVAILAIITIVGLTMNPDCYATNFAEKNLPPSAAHLFGTDWMGRDMFMRTIKGLSTSIYIGLLASAVTSIVALFLGVLAGTIGKWATSAFNWMVDLFMGVPHLILLILISVLTGRGARGVMIGVIVTHWCPLGRIVQAEIMSLKNSQYVQAAQRMGKTNFYIAMKHMLPHVIPQFVVGLVLMFPHAIMHEASITFLGFGLPAEQPAIGVILSESMKYLTTGMWWLALLPGLCLLVIVVLFEAIGTNLRLLIDPFSAQG